MKRKLLVILLSIVSIFSLTFGLTACFDDDESGDQNSTQQGGGTGGDKNPGNSGNSGNNGGNSKPTNPGDDDEEKLKQEEEEKKKQEEEEKKKQEEEENKKQEEEGGSGSGSTDGKEEEKPAEKTPDYDENGLAYYLSADGQSYSCSGLGTSTRTDIVIAETLNGIPVTSIGGSAFINSKITSVEIPKSITSIGSNAFEGCAGLKEVTVPDSVTSMGYAAFALCTGLESVVLSKNLSVSSPAQFYGCTALESITLSLSGLWSFNYIFNDYWVDFTPVKLKTVVITGGSSIPNNSFEGFTKLKNVTIPETVTYISSAAFKDCTSLETLTIPQSVTTIDYRVFEGCTGLQSLIIPDSVTSIGDGVFKNCTNLKSLTLPFVPYDFVDLFDDSGYLASAENVPQSLKTVTVTGGTSIFSRAFYGCSGIASVKLPSSITYIGESAFEGCSSLESFEVPKGATDIGEKVFSGCTNLQTLTVAEGNEKYYAQNNCIIDRDTKTLKFGCAGSTIPADGSVTAIAKRAFYGCDGLKNIIIPSTVTLIGDYAFYGCDGLESITVPYTGNGDYYKNFGHLFGGYGDNNGESVPQSLKTVIITGGDSIDYYAFSGCRYIENVILPANLSSIGEKAFYGCSSLKSINIPETVSSIGAYAFTGCSGLKNLTLSEGVSSIGYYAFSGCSGLESLHIPARVTSIGNGVIAGCTSITSITVSEDNTEYHSAGNCLIQDATKYLVAGCKTSVIPDDDSVNTIWASAFEGQSTIKTITLPDKITEIDWGAFMDCAGLTEITLPDSVTEIGRAAFMNCSGLKSAVIPDSVTYISDAVFSGCSSLQSLSIPYIGSYKKSGEDISWSYPLGYLFGTDSYEGGVATEQSYWSDFNLNVTTQTFYIPSSLKNVTVTGGNIGFGAFDNCNRIENVVISGNGIRVYNNAFMNCKKLKSVTLPDSLKYIEENAFAFCSSLESITIPSGVVAIGTGAFRSCITLNSVTFKVCAGWKRGSGVEISSDDLADPQTAATCLTSTYANEPWARW